MSRAGLGFKCCWSGERSSRSAGYWSLPGGKLWGDEALDEAAWRQLAEKTALRASYLEQLYTFELCDTSRQMEAAVVAYYALVRTDDAEIAPGRKTMEAAWFPVDWPAGGACLRQRGDPPLRAPAPPQQGGVRPRGLPVPAPAIHHGAAPRRVRGDPRPPHRSDELPSARRGHGHHRPDWHGSSRVAGTGHRRSTGASATPRLVKTMRPRRPLRSIPDPLSQPDRDVVAHAPPRTVLVACK